MTGNLVVLLAAPPDLSDVLAIVAAAAPEVLARTACHDKVLQFFSDPERGDSQPLFEVVRPALVAVPGEVGRLLGAETARTAPATPWWVDISVRNDDTYAEQLALLLASALVVDSGGTVWTGS
jgi:hypothetical protein